MAAVMTPEELKALMVGDQQPAIYDVRRKADFESSPKKIQGAVRLDPEKADEWMVDIPVDKPVVFYCVKGGSVSQSTADRFQHTHNNVKFLHGGIKAWAELDEPLEE